MSGDRLCLDTVNVAIFIHRWYLRTNSHRNERILRGNVHDWHGLFSTVFRDYPTETLCALPTHGKISSSLFDSCQLHSWLSLPVRFLHLDSTEERTSHESLAPRQALHWSTTHCRDCFHISNLWRAPCRCCPHLHSSPPAQHLSSQHPDCLFLT